MPSPATCHIWRLVSRGQQKNNTFFPRENGQTGWFKHGLWTNFLALFFPATFLSKKTKNFKILVYRNFCGFFFKFYTRPFSKKKNWKFSIFKLFEFYQFFIFFSGIEICYKPMLEFAWEKKFFVRNFYMVPNLYINIRKNEKNALFWATIFLQKFLQKTKKNYFKPNFNHMLETYFGPIKIPLKTRNLWSLLSKVPKMLIFAL